MSTHTKIGSLMEAWLQEQQRAGGEKVEALDTLLDRSQAELSAFLGKLNSVGAFRHFDWSEDGVEMLQPRHFGPEQYAHIKAGGFEGAFVEYTPGDPIFDQWELLAGLLGGVVRGGRAVVDSRL